MKQMFSREKREFITTPLCRTPLSLMQFEIIPTQVVAALLRGAFPRGCPPC